MQFVTWFLSVSVHFVNIFGLLEIQNPGELWEGTCSFFILEEYLQ